MWKRLFAERIALIDDTEATWSRLFWELDILCSNPALKTGYPVGFQIIARC